MRSTTTTTTTTLLLAAAATTNALDCSSFHMQSTCAGCTSSGECTWHNGQCMAMQTANCGEVGVTHDHNHTMMDDDHVMSNATMWDVSGGCTFNGNFPFYCTSAEAEAVAEAGGSSGSHTHHGFDWLWMPNDYPGMIHDGSYKGDAPVCDCPFWDVSGACSFAGNFPFYCTAAEAESVAEAGGSSGFHTHHSASHLFMPTGYPAMTHDGSYVGDAPSCECWDFSGACQDLGRWPVYCDSDEASAVSFKGTGEAGFSYLVDEPYLFFPTYSDNVLDGSYDGDAPLCNCTNDTAYDLSDGLAIDPSSGSSGSSKKRKNSNSAMSWILPVVVVAAVLLAGAALAALCCRRIHAKDDPVRAQPAKEVELQSGIPADGKEDP